MELITKLLTSRKFVVMLASAIGLAITKWFKVEVEQSTIMEFVILIGSYIVGQSIVDHGKGAAKVEAISNLTANQDVTAAETKKAVEEIKSV